MRIWIDTDLGTDVDDALTLAYVLRHPGFELVGVSTVFGEVSPIAWPRPEGDLPPVPTSRAPRTGFM